MTRRGPIEDENVEYKVFIASDAAAKEAPADEVASPKETKAVLSGAGCYGHAFRYVGGTPSKTECPTRGGGVHAHRCV